MTRGPFNVVQAVTISATYIAIKHIFTDVHINAGFFKPIRFTLPPTCFLNAQPPASCSAYTETSQRVIDVVFGALGKALPERLFGAPFSTISVITIAGQDAARGYYVAYMYFGGGFGGSRHSDGLNHANAPFGLALIPPLEVHEQRFPLLFHQFGLRPDSGGAGQHRGGLGGAYEFSFLGEEAHISLAGDRGKFPPFGVNGGKPGAKNEVTFTFNGDSAPPPLLTKADRLLIHQHDRVRVESPGGGGFGDPFERDPQLVLEDVRRGYVSVETARQAYGVEVDTANWKVDETATGELRNAGAEGES
jgi:N-methylhydantoinase B